MTPDYDVIIVGSGPAGVSAAFPLVESGLRVLMVDGGRQVTKAPLTEPFLTARVGDVEQWKWMIGDDFHALKMRDAVSPKLRVPAHGYVFEGFETGNHIGSNGGVVVGSLAAGGLSNAWGCGVSRLSDAELVQYPFRYSDIEQSYEAVANRIGLSGGRDDDLSDFFGLDAWLQPPIKMDLLHSDLLSRYEKQRKYFSSLGFRLGRSRIAVLSKDHFDRKACDNTGNCLWGCHRRALYSATDELYILQRCQNFSYINDFVVEEIVRSENLWSIKNHSTDKLSGRPITSRKIVLAAGTIATTRLVLKSLKINRSIRMLSCPIAAFMLCLPRHLGNRLIPSFGFGQLSYTLNLLNNVTAFGSTFGVTGIPVAEFLRHLPFSRRYGADLLKMLLGSCIVGNLFLPGDLSSSEVKLKDDGTLLVTGGYEEEVTRLMKVAAPLLRKAFLKLGAILLPGSFTVGSPGGDIHYAGTLPMRETPGLGETNALGEVCGLEGVHVVDGACLSSLPGKSHTLTIMANADRIGRKLASIKYLEVQRNE